MSDDKGKANKPDHSGPRKRKLAMLSGWQQGNTIHPPGADVELSRAEESVLDGLGLLEPKRAMGADGAMASDAKSMTR